MIQTNGKTTLAEGETPERQAERQRERGKKGKTKFERFVGSITVNSRVNGVATSENFKSVKINESLQAAGLDRRPYSTSKTTKYWQLTRGCPDVDPRFIRGSGTAIVLRSCLLIRVTMPICLCKTFSWTCLA